MQTAAHGAARLRTPAAPLRSEPPRDRSEAIELRIALTINCRGRERLDDARAELEARHALAAGGRQGGPKAGEVGAAQTRIVCAVLDYTAQRLPM